MNITVEIKDVYGSRVVYPACEAAKAFARIAGTKTLTPATLREIEALGYSIDVKSQGLESFGLTVKSFVQV
jgi:hypothetical protein